MSGDGYGSSDRNLLRVVEGHGAYPFSPGDVARQMGESVQRVTATARALAQGGLLEAFNYGGRTTYRVTDAGRAELAAHRTRKLLVEADDRMADEVAAWIAGNVNGVTDVSDHGDGCCCQHCPHGGDCR